MKRKMQVKKSKSVDFDDLRSVNFHFGPQIWWDRERLQWLSISPNRPISCFRKRSPRSIFKPRNMASFVKDTLKVLLLEWKYNIVFLIHSTFTQHRLHSLFNVYTTLFSVEELWWIFILLFSSLCVLCFFFNLSKWNGYPQFVLVPPVSAFV